MKLKSYNQQEIPPGLEGAQPHVRRELQDIPEPPCVKYNCSRLQECKTDEKACEAFHFFVHTGKSPAPGTVWKKGRFSILPQAYPSKAMFRRVFSTGASKKTAEKLVTMDIFGEPDR